MSTSCRLIFGARGRFALALLAALISLVFCLILAWYGFAFCTSPTSRTGMPRPSGGRLCGCPYFAVPLGHALLSLQYVAEIWRW